MWTGRTYDSCPRVLSVLILEMKSSRCALLMTFRELSFQVGKAAWQTMQSPNQQICTSWRCLHGSQQTTMTMSLHGSTAPSTCSMSLRWALARTLQCMRWSLRACGCLKTG